MPFRKDLNDMNKRQQEADARKAANELGNPTNYF